MAKDIKINYTSIENIIKLAKESDVNFSDIIISEQKNAMEISETELFLKMEERYKVMKEAISDGLSKKNELKIEQVGAAKNYYDYIVSNKSILGEIVGEASASAMAVSELNASMGRICASPTAGSCGIMPGAILTIEKHYHIEKNETIRALFTAAGVGMVISNVMGVAGATAGCQAECGAATAMSAASIVEMLGGTPDMVGDAIAIALKNIEGLVCDPVAGLVECPCIKRNANCAVSAIVASDLALAGIKSVIPVDEVILSAKQVGNLMDYQLKETALGGLAVSETGKKLKNKIFS